MPRLRKNKTRVKQKNKQKIVVKNVLNINSNNKRKVLTKPSFAQMAQQPKSTSPVISHFIQNPQSAYNPQGESSLVKSMEIMNNLINKYAEREGKLYNESLDRLKTQLIAPKTETPLQDASKGRKFTFDYESLLNSPSGSVKSEPPPKTPIKSLLGGRRSSPLGIPEVNTLSPLSRVGLSEAQVKRELEIMGATATTDDRNRGRKFLRHAYTVMGVNAPEGPNTKPSTYINDLLVNKREGLAKHWTAIKDIPNQKMILEGEAVGIEAVGGGGKAKKKIPERSKSK